jgi:hypothetical protein
MKVAVVYTGTSSIPQIEKELKSAINSSNLSIMIYADPTIIEDAVACGRVPPSAAKRLIKMYLDAVTAGADVVLNICSSVGDVADSMKPAFRAMGVPFIRVDEGMAIHAIECGKRIGVLATLQTTLDPTKRLIQRCAEAMGVQVEIVDALAQGVYAKSGAEVERILSEAACGISKRVDVIVLAQASMAVCQESIAKASGKIVLSSPKFGAAEVAKAIDGLKSGE